MSDADSLIIDLADACQQQADVLLSIESGLDGNDPNYDTIQQKETALRSRADRLRGMAVSDALRSNQAALDQLKQATAEAKRAALTIKHAQTALSIVGDLLSLAAAVISGNIGGIGSASGALVKHVVGILGPAPAG